MLLANDVAGGDEPMTVILTGKLEVEDWHKYLPANSIEIADGASCDSVIDLSRANIPAI
jgi:hypothetical protein